MASTNRGVARNLLRGKGDKRGGVGDGSPPAGSRGRAPVGLWGQSPQKLETNAKIFPAMTGADSLPPWLRHWAPNSTSAGAPPAGGDYSAPQTPYLYLRGLLLKRRRGRGEGKERGGKRKERIREGKVGEGFPPTGECGSTSGASQYLLRSLNGGKGKRHASPSRITKRNNTVVQYRHKQRLPCYPDTRSGSSSGSRYPRTRRTLGFFRVPTGYYQRSLLACTRVPLQLTVHDR